MRPLLRLATLALLLTTLAGCVDSGSDDKENEDTTPPASPYGTWEFDIVQVDDVKGTSEPGILAARDGTIWIVGPTGFVTPIVERDPEPYSHDSGVFFSTDGGTTWAWNEQVPSYGRDPCVGGGDSDIAEAPDGALFLIDLNLENVPIDVSTDHGKTWTFNCHTGTPGLDRQWVAATDEHVWISVNHLTNGPIVYRSDRLGLPVDGLVFGPPVFVEMGGVIVVDNKDGTLYLAGSGAVVEVSKDMGATWAAHETGLKGEDLANSFISIAVDQAGNVFVAGAGKDGVVVSGSKDKGESWSAATRFHPYDGEYGFAWVAAGGDGVVNVAWYGRPNENDTSPFKPETYGYYLFAGQSTGVLNGTGPQTIARVSPTPVTTKQLCVGINLVPPTPCDVADPSKTRALGDFFEAGMDLEGNLLITYNDAEANDPPLLMFAKQKSGGVKGLPNL